MKDKKSVIVIVGPTASGKSELAVKIAKLLGSEIISADSRQIYKYMDIGTGKVEGKWKDDKFIYKKVPHYLIDVANPKRQYSVAQFQKKALAKISELHAQGKVPIICGGTAHWIDAVVLGQTLPEVKPDLKLRRELNKMSVMQLYKKLLKLDPRRAKEIDAKNPRRLIRAIEIVISSGQPVPIMNSKSSFDVLWLGINPGKEKLEKKIGIRLKQRLEKGMIEEVKTLRELGLSWKRLEGFGLEYKYCALYLQKKITKEEMQISLCSAIKKYAKRQLTWWKPNKNINWSEEPEALFQLAKKSFPNP